MEIRKRIFEIVKLDEENTLTSIIYHRVMQLAIVLSIIPLMFRQQNVGFVVIDITVTVLFITDYLLRWMTADMRSKHKGWKAFALYPFTLIAIVDLLTILPVITYFNNSLRVLRVWRLLRLLRIMKIFKYFAPLQIVLAVFRKKASVLLTVVGFSVFYIFITALVMFNVETSTDPQTGQVFFHDFFDALYWSTCTLTTVGYGDIYPTSNVGRSVSMLSSLVGIAIIALPSGIITAGYMEEVHERRRRKEKKKQERQSRKQAS